MRLGVRSAVGALLLATASPAAERPLAGKQVAAHAPRGAPLLWRVDQDGRTSHLFGTVHVGLDLDATLQEAGRAALDGSKRVFVELDLTSPATIAVALRDMVDRAELPPGQSLRALLTPRAWERLMAISKGRLPPELLDRMDPSFVELQILPLLLARGRTEGGPAWQHAPLLDAAIAARAKAHGIQVSALETPLQQIQIFVGTGRKEAVTSLEELVKDPESNRRELEGLVGAYASDDERSLRKAFGRLVRRKPALAERLLFRRNELWCQRLGLWFGDGGMFVAAGAFHMFGERGLVELLRRRGYRVERVRAGGTRGG